MLFTILYIKLFTVPKEQRTRAVQCIRRRRLHTINPVFRRSLQTGVSRSGNLEEVYEEVCKDHCESIGCIRGYREEGIPKSSEGGKNRVYFR